MPFKKGNKLGGRTKGAVNRYKYNRDVKANILELVENNLPLVQEKMNELEPRDWLRFYADLLPYVLPKMKAIEIHDTSEKIFQPIIIQDDTNK